MANRVAIIGGSFLGGTFGSFSTAVAWNYYLENRKPITPPRETLRAGDERRLGRLYDVTVEDINAFTYARDNARAEIETVKKRLNNKYEDE